MLPTGIISLWYGSLVTVPAGWVICDGNNGTPNLEEKFIRGSSVASPPDDTGGSATHTHNFTGDGHNHSFGAGAIIGAGANLGTFTDTKPATGTTDNGNSLPPFHSLYYIMKT